MSLATIDEKILLSEREAAGVLRLSVRTLYNMRKAGMLPFVRAKSRILYRRSALEAWAEANEQHGN